VLRERPAGPAGSAGVLGSDGGTADGPVGEEPKRTGLPAVRGVLVRFDRCGLRGVLREQVYGAGGVHVHGGEGGGRERERGEAEVEAESVKNLALTLIYLCYWCT